VRASVPILTALPPITPATDNGVRNGKGATVVKFSPDGQLLMTLGDIGRGDGSSARFGQYCRMGVRTRRLDIATNARRQVADEAMVKSLRGLW
jgi:hypothetical protein